MKIIEDIVLILAIVIGSAIIAAFSAVEWARDEEDGEDGR